MDCCDLTLDTANCLMIFSLRSIVSKITRYVANCNELSRKEFGNRTKAGIKRVAPVDRRSAKSGPVAELSSVLGFRRSVYLRDVNNLGNSTEITTQSI